MDGRHLGRTGEVLVRLPELKEDVDKQRMSFPNLASRKT
jgi:hypothetical protein